MIRVDLKSARGQTLRSLTADPDFDPVLAGIDRTQYPMLGHLDPYGDTILNRMQVGTLLAEVSTLRSELAIIPHSFADELEDMCAECLRRPHHFLWFVGE
jgi:hypothetical protein